MSAPSGIYVRLRGPITTTGRVFGPFQTVTARYPSCVACGKRFEIGDRSVLIPLGPGDDPEEREKHKAGRFYVAAAVEVHYECAGSPPTQDAEHTKGDT